MPRALPRLICALALIAVAFAGCTNRRAQEETAIEEQVTPVGAQAVTTGSLRAVIHATGVITPAAGAEFLVTSPEQRHQSLGTLAWMPPSQRTRTTAVARQFRAWAGTSFRARTVLQQPGASPARFC